VTKIGELGTTQAATSNRRTLRILGISSQQILQLKGVCIVNFTRINLNGIQGLMADIWKELHKFSLIII
jgi:hypothetical protein